MKDINCEICLEDLTNDEKNVPRMLSCGHSYCTNCIVQLIKTTKLCPKCDIKINTESIDEISINYSLINVLETYDPKTDLKDTFQTLIKEMNFIRSQMTELETRFGSIATHVNVLQEYLTKDDKELDVAGVYKWIIQVRRKFKTSVSSLRYKELRDSATFQISHDEFSPDLVDLYNEVKKSSAFYVFTKFKDEMKYAKMTVTGSRLILHAFVDTCDKRRMNSICLDDFKILLKNKTIVPNGFLEFECNKRGVTRNISIAPFHTMGGDSFLKFCTGENGSSFKGSTISTFNNQMGNARINMMFTIVKDALIQDTNAYLTKSSVTSIMFKDHLGEIVVGWCETKNCQPGLSVCHIYEDPKDSDTYDYNHDDIVELGSEGCILNNFVGIVKYEGDASFAEINLTDDNLSVVDCGISFNVL